MGSSSQLRALRKAAIDWFMRMRNADTEDPRRSHFEAWLMAHPAHRQAYAEVSDLWHDFDSTAQLQSLAAAVAQKEFLEKEQRARKRKNLVAATLGIMLTVSAGLFGYRSWQAQPVMQMAASAGTGQIVSQQLEDGSTLTLNAGSDIEITYYRDRRLARLKRGEAIFEVARDEDRPFVVESGPAQVTVLGTRFAVNRLQDLVRVSVDHGRVRVEAPETAGNHLGAAIVLRDGEVAEIRPSGDPQRVSRTATDAFGFARGVIIFDKTGLEEIAETLSRYRPQPVEVRTAANSDVHVTAVIKTVDIEKFLAQLPRVAPVTIESTPQRTLIVERPQP